MNIIRTPDRKRRMEQKNIRRNNGQYSSNLMKDKFRNSRNLGSTNKNKNTCKGTSASRKMEMCFPLILPLNITIKPGHDIKYTKNLKARKNKADRSWDLGTQGMTQ